MNQTIAISSFAGMLSKQSGYTAEFCERFAAEMFKTVAEGLKESNEVTIKGLGTFVADNDGNVSFAPDNSFAAAVNAPFDCFEPEILDDDVTDELLSDGIIDGNGQEEVVDETEVASEAETDNASTDTVGVDEVIEEEPEERINALEDKIDDLEDEIDDFEDEIDRLEDEIDDLENESIKREGDEPQKDIEEEIENIEKEIDEIEKEIDGIEDEIESIEDKIEDDFEDNEDISAETDRSKRNGVWHFICGIALGAVIGAAVTYFVVVPQVRQGDRETQIENKIVAEELGSTNSDNNIVSDNGNAVGDDTDKSADNATNSNASDNTTIIEESTIEQSDNSKTTDETPVYDTVTSTLSQLSRKHYGKYQFWVYIYEENKDVISNPDKVEPGTRVRIPSAKRYGIDAKSHESINTALKKAREIANESQR